MSLLSILLFVPAASSENVQNNINNDRTLNRPGHRPIYLAQAATPGLPVYDVKNYHLLADSIAAIGTNQAILVISNEQLLQANTTIPANIKLQFSQTGIFNIASGVTVTVSGTLDAGPHQVFSGPGSVMISNSSVKASPQWWGAKGDGNTDDTIAIQKAINASNNIYLAKGTYVLGTITPGSSYLENRLLVLRSNISIMGDGPTSVLKLKDHLLDNPDDNNSNAHMMGGNDLSSITIANVKFDMNGANNLNPSGKIRNAMALFILGGNNISIKNSFFNNCAGHNVIALRESAKNVKSYNAYIAKNIFKNGGRYVGTPKENINNTDFSFLYTVWDNSIIEENTIEQEDINIGMHNWSGGIEIHGNNAKVINNKITGCDPAMYVASSPKAIEKIVISGNIMHNCLRGITFFLYNGNIKDVEITRNSIELTQSKLRTWGDCTGIQVPHGGTDVFDAVHANAGFIEKLNVNYNTITSNLPSGLQYQCKGMEIHSLHNSKIMQNSINGMSDTGISFLGSPWGSINVDITNNKILDCGRTAKNAIYRNSIYFKQDGSSKTPSLPFYVTNVNISNNALGNTNEGGSEYSGMGLINIPASKIKNLTISGNTFSNSVNKLYDGNNNIFNLEALNPEAHFIP